MGVLLVMGHVVDKSIELVAIFEDQGVEGAGVSLAGARHEVLVRVGGTGLTEHSGWGWVAAGKAYMDG